MKLIEKLFKIAKLSLNVTSYTAVATPYTPHSVFIAVAPYAATVRHLSLALSSILSRAKFYNISYFQRYAQAQ
jgi:hypothetical protein